MVTYLRSPVSPRSILVSYDVSALFTNVPLEETIQILANKACSIDDVIVFGRNELWVIKKHMVKCRVESVVVCIYFG